MPGYGKQGDKPPGFGRRDAPSLVARSGENVTAFWVKPKSAPPPEAWHVRVPHKGKSTWVVYMLFLGVLFSCIIAVTCLCL